MLNLKKKDWIKNLKMNFKLINMSFCKIGDDYIYDFTTVKMVFKVIN